MCEAGQFGLRNIFLWQKYHTEAMTRPATGLYDWSPRGVLTELVSTSGE
jgi:hypothetical protein